MRLNLSRAWRPADGGVYGNVELTMLADFQRDDATLWGIVNAKGLTRSVGIERLRIVGAPEWHSRFDWMNLGPNAHPWQEALGGSQGGGPTALAGIHAVDCKSLRIRRLEVIGVPGCGLRYERTKVRIDSAFFDRCGWPIFEHHDSVPGSDIRYVTSRDHWNSDAWGPNNQQPGVSLKRMATKGISARGELVMNSAGYVLEGYTQQGDGIGWKCAGTQFAIHGYQGGPCFLNGTVPANLTTFPDPVRYRHLHESYDISVMDSVFGTCWAKLQSRALLYVAYPFSEPPRFVRCTFRKTHQPYAVQLNTGARAVFENCTFIGWPDAQSAIELDKRPGFESDASVPDCRFYAEAA